MGWYVLQVMTGTERDVCEALRRKGVQARAPAQRMEIRRRGQWHEEDCLLLPGYIFVGAEYTAVSYTHLLQSSIKRWKSVRLSVAVPVTASVKEQKE